MSQMDCFLKIDSVDGGSTDARHRNEILLQTWSFGASNAAATSPGGAARVTLRDLVITKALDKASVRLFVASCSGERFKTATLTCRNAGGSPVEFLTVTLSAVTITSYLVAAPSDGGLPEEQVTLAYSRIVMSGPAQGAAGAPGAAIVGGWDGVANRKL